MNGGAETGDDQPTVTPRVLFVSGSRATPQSLAHSIAEHFEGTPATAVGVVLDGPTLEWERAFEAPAIETETIDVDIETRSTTASSQSVDSERSVSTPASLSSIATRVLEVLDSQDAPVVLWIHSLAALLAHFERERVFRFVHAAGELAARHGGTCYLPVSMDRHDPATIELFGTICTVVRVDADDSVGSL